MKLFTKINEFKQYLDTIAVPKLRLPKEPNTTDYKDIDISDIELVEQGDDGKSIIHLGVKINNELEEGIILDIQLINDMFYQPHITIHDDLQKQKLGTKIYKKFVNEFGNIYSSKGRRHNNNIIKLLSQFKNDPNYTYIENERNDIIVILNSNPDKNILISQFNSII